jgi:2-deoxy-D-gluconate 3-dehydrogenase
MISNAFSLAERCAMITGANTGIGQVVAIALAAAGADIIAVGRSDPAETQSAVLSMGRRFSAIHADLSQPQDMSAVAEAALAEFGKIDILVNNAGIVRRNDAVDFGAADWDAVMDVNLKSVFFLTQAVGRRMIEVRRGKVINIASMLSFQGGIRVASYTASKSALAGLTRLLANEWAAKGVNVNAIAPGYIATSNTQALQADETRNREILARIPAGRWGQPADIGGAAVFLSASASDYVHGAIIPVDGGWLAR